MLPGTTVPTSEALPRFTMDLQHLAVGQRRRFHRIVRNAFVPDLSTGLHDHSPHGSDRPNPLCRPQL
ncbi:hypothetical protein BX264_7128 [Streptomyces sp. 2333.5]|nr:hypothetical protein BX264_0018 [Streptomyces sp. 2333.5]SEB58685.1 hypothetical protein SAMN05428943_0018 [Streptomyces sp. 2314.4]SEC39529.1 hypothetical protein SAMN05428942_0018 [Streptomyces sp. 2112.2]PJJ06587.1 hypothetical protein BX264_7128 [Streptomyces sp. 2333.5]SEE97246.1 hypothetical protein SAMN05428943_7227 [Streptomyces sp. 2314.4]